MSEAREYLERLKLLDVMIDCKQDELAALESMVKRITPVMNPTGAAGGGSQDGRENALAKLVDLKAEINRDIDEFVNLKREIARLLRKVRKPEFYQVLQKRYVLYKSFAQIAAEMNITTERGASKLNGRALQAFGKVMEEERKRGKRLTDERMLNK